MTKNYLIIFLVNVSVILSVGFFINSQQNDLTKIVAFNKEVSGSLVHLNETIYDIKNKLTVYDEHINLLEDRLEVSKDMGLSEESSNKVHDKLLIDKVEDVPEKHDDFLTSIETGSNTVHVSPAEDQKQFFNDLMLMLDDPYLTQSLSMQKLVEMESMRKLPQALQYVVMSKAMKKYKNGEISKDVFLSLSE